MRRIILFRFHRRFHICVNHLAHFKRVNPDVPIHGIYGGEPSDLEEASRALAPYLEEIWEIPVSSGEWKWKNGDLAIQLWFRSRGKDLEFDVVHTMDWDLLILGPLDEIFGDAGYQGVALTGVTPLERVGAKWYWTSVEPAASEWVKLKEHLSVTKGWNGPYLACQGPASVLSREFIEAFSAEEVPEYGNEEVRMAIYAQALGFRVTPLSHIYREIQDPEEMKFFNCECIPIKAKTIRSELKKADGRRVFHPFLKKFRRRKWWLF